MTSIATIAASNWASNSAFLQTLSYIPVAIFVGGTSGIGQGTAEAFAAHTKGNAHIIIIGRNKTAAERIISNFPRPTSDEAKHEFLHCDATLMANVQKITAEILSRVSRLNYLVMSPGYSTLKNRDESIEGLDRKLAVHYYARWKFTNDLMPALQRAKEQGQEAKVLSVLGTGRYGRGDGINVDDLGMKKSFSKAHLNSAGGIYNDLMFQEFHVRNPDITFSHAYPGIVDTNYAANSESMFLRGVGKATFPVLRVALRPWMHTYKQSGENMLHGMLTTSRNAGAWRVGQDGGDIGMARYYGSIEERKALWNHTVAELSSITA